jgi:hypothetical protein
MYRRANPQGKRNTPTDSNERRNDLPSEEAGGTTPSYQRIKSHRRQRRQDERRASLVMMGWRVIAYLAVTGVLIFIARITVMRTSTLASGIDERIHIHLTLYDSVYNNQIVRDKKDRHTVNDDTTAWLDIDNKNIPSTLGSVYGPNVTACPVTVLFMDPRLGDPSYGPGRPAWFALESVAAFSHDACVLLLTSTCVMKEYLPNMKGKAEEEKCAENAVKNLVYSRSLPLFRNMMAQGRVRISFLETTRYHLKSCRDFGNPTGAFIHVDFWKDEFIQGIDSDLVLMMQDDAVLCTPLQETLVDYQNYAYVGGVWPRKASKLNPHPPQGMCLGMPGLWKSWMLPQRRWERFDQGLTNKAVEKPKQLLVTEFPTVCENGLGPVGNGGFSLRSRSWMIQAITACPHVKLSGMDTSAAEALACKVLDDVNEDLYFSVILRGLRAPLPSAVEAALFSVEMMWPEDAMLVYGAPSGKADLLTNPTKPRRQISNQNGRVLTVPVGLHKPFWYHPTELLRSESMRQSCPFLPYIFTPEMSRWRAFGSVTQWAGVGS